MRTLSLIVLMVVLVGCTIDADPMRAAVAHERTSRADNAQLAQVAQVAQAQSADADRRNAQAMLQAWQAQQAIVAGQAAVAHSSAISSIVASTNETTLLLADKMIEAAKPDYRPLYGAMAGLVVVAIVWTIVHGRKAVVVAAPTARPMGTRVPEPAQQTDKPVVVYMTEHAFAYRLPDEDETIILHRYRDGKERIYLPTDPFYQRLLTGGKQ